MLLRSSSRTGGLIGGWLAVAAGAWFAIGPTVSLLWHHAGNPIGAPMVDIRARRSSGSATSKGSGF